MKNNLRRELQAIDVRVATSESWLVLTRTTHSQPTQIGVGRQVSALCYNTAFTRTYNWLACESALTYT